MSSQSRLIPLPVPLISPTLPEPGPEIEEKSDIYPPFNIAKTDLNIILRTSDGFNIHGLKIFLAIASPFFNDMFGLPTPTQAPFADETKNGIPVVPITEKRKVMENLLMFCYPTWSSCPTFETLDDVQDVLEAATKYDMEGVVKRAGQALTAEFVETSPLRAFAIACRYKLVDAVKLAAGYTLRVPVSERTYIRELDYITAASLQLLLDYHFQCGKAAQGVAKSYQWITRDDYTWFNFSCVVCSGWGKTITIAGMKYRLAAAFWLNFMNEVSFALMDSPCSATVMREDLLAKAIKESKACSTCFKSTKSRTMDDMLSFRQLLAAEVEKALVPIQLTINF